MRYGWAVIVAFGAGCGLQGDGAPIRAQLSDGQLLSGDLLTDTLVLESGVGTLHIPLEDVGEVVPTEASQLGYANGQVTVWMRDGSEFVGRWADPEMLVAIDVGGDTIEVDLPMDRLARLQTRAGEIWTDGTAYRVRTIFGDDFLVDPEHTRLVVENDLGRFSPFLSECASARPLGDRAGDWRIELTNGTVLVGPLADASITFALANGPEQVTVPLASLSWLERVWFTPASPKQVAADERTSGGAYWDAPAAVPEASAAPAPARARPADGWFSNAALKDVKEQQVAR